MHVCKLTLRSLIRESDVSFLSSLSTGISSLFVVANMNILFGDGFLFLQNITNLQASATDWL